MAKHLKTVVKECRRLLEHDFAVHIPDVSPDAVQEMALTFLLTFASLRCVEEQLWNIPRPSPNFACYTPEYITTTSQKIQKEIPLFFQNRPSSLMFPSTNTLAKLTHHFVVTISPEDWRSEHILGWLYQYFNEDTTEQKQQGRFYTPEPIARYIVAQAWDILQNAHNGELPPSLSVLDLACGAGMFALSAFDRLYQHRRQQQEGNRQHIAQHIAEHKLFMIDNDPWACRIAAFHLYLKVKALQPTAHINTLNVYHGDALQRWEHHQQHSPLKALFTRKYDLVVGNPPYRVINQLRCTRNQLRCYKSYQAAAFKINTFALFMERGLELLRPGGVLGMIVPNTFLTQVYFEPLRKYVLATSAVHRILDTKRMFDNAFVENCIVLLQRQADAAKRRSHIIECRVKPSAATFPLPENSEQIGEFAEIYIPQHHFENTPFKMFNLHLDEATLALLEKMTNGNPTLGDICESHDGVNPGNIKHKLILSEPVDETCQKVLNGKNIGRYRLKWGGLYVRYNRAVLCQGDNVRWGHRPSLDAPKILTRQTADRLIGTFDHGTYYVTNSIHTTVLQEGVHDFSLKYILALVNSRLLSFYYRTLIAETGQVFSQVKLINLRRIPLKLIPIEEQKVFVKIVESLLHRASQGLDKSEHPLLQECRAREIDDRLDARIYALFKLSAADIQRVEAKMGQAVCLFPKVPWEELRQEISPEHFREQYALHAKNIFRLAEYYKIHPESLLALQQQYPPGIEGDERNSAGAKFPPPMQQY